MAAGALVKVDTSIGGHGFRGDVPTAGASQRRLQQRGALAIAGAARSSWSYSDLEMGHELGNNRVLERKTG